MPDFSFRSLRTDDLPRLHVWFHAPHAVRWWGMRGSLDAITAEYTEYIEGRVPIHAFIVSLDGRDIGLFSWERFADFPDLMRLYGVTDPNACNCDVIIGEPDAAHRGLGAHLVRQFLREVVFSDPTITSCVIDPEPENHIAIRAYAKAGFRHVRTAPDDGEGNPVYLMELTRAELFAGS